MKIKISNVKKFQEGGAMEEVPMPAGGDQTMELAPVEQAPAGPEQGGDPMQQILEAAVQAVKNNDGQLALLVCAALVQMAQSAQGGQPGDAAEAPEGEPVYRKGGRLAYRKK